jgi:hypothetical protein
LGKICYILAAFTELGMEYASIAILIGSVLATSSVLLGAKYQQGKGKAKQLTDLLTSIIEAAQDDEVTEKESQKIVASAQELLQKLEAESS